VFGLRGRTGQGRQTKQRGNNYHTEFSRLLAMQRKKLL
jgi:hypothetical protein